MGFAGSCKTDDILGVREGQIQEIWAGRLLSIDIGERYGDRFVFYSDDNTPFYFLWGCVGAMNTQDSPGNEVILTKFFSIFLGETLSERGGHLVRKSWFSATVSM